MANNRKDKALWEGLFGEMGGLKTTPAPTASQMSQTSADILARGHAQTVLDQLSKGNLEASESRLNDLKKEADAARGELQKSQEGHAAGMAAAEQKVKDTTAAYEAQKAVVDGIRKSTSDTRDLERQREALIKSMTTSLARVQEQVRDTLANPYALPAETQVRKEQERLAGELSKVQAGPALRQQAAAYMSRYRGDVLPLSLFQFNQRRDRMQKLADEQQEQFAREEARLDREAIPPVEIRQLGGKEGVTRADVEKDINAAWEERRRIAQDLYTFDKAQVENRKVERGDVEGEGKKRLDLLAVEHAKKDADRQADITHQQDMRRLNEEDRKLETDHRIAMSKMDLETRVADIKEQADLAARRAEMGFKGQNPAEGIREAYRIRMQLAQDLYQEELKRIDLEEKGWQAQFDKEIALRNLRREEAKERADAELKLAEMIQHQMDTIKSTVEPLMQTLFEHPTKFGGQLRDTLHQSIMKPIYSGLSEMTSRALHPLIFGASGTGGVAGAIAGVFGVKGEKGDRNNPIYANIVNFPSEGGGTGGGWFPGGGGTMPAGTSVFGLPGMPGWGGLSIPNTWTGGGGGGTNPYIMSFAGGGAAGAAAPAESGTGYFGMGSLFPGFGNAPLATAMQAATMGATGAGRSRFGSLLGGLAGIIPTGGFGRPGGSVTTPPFMGTDQYGIPVSGVPVGPLPSLNMPWYRKLGIDPKMFFNADIAAKAGGGFTGGLAGAATSPMAGMAAIMGGSHLAMAGLAGGRRGTWGGFGESVGGGALTGAGIGLLVGGPMGALIGAGIGAAAGAVAAGLEMAFGVESPRREALRLVKEKYGLNISNSMADQIVQIANQSYAGHVSQAVVSPQVRQMLGLYAAGTGQSSVYAPQSGQAYGGSLVESGGRLMQQATYQYGIAHTYSSNLPVYGGVNSVGLQAPGGNVQLSLNIAGNDAATFLRGNVVTPDVVNNAYSNSMAASNGRAQQALQYSSPGATLA